MAYNRKTNRGKCRLRSLCACFWVTTDEESTVSLWARL